MKIIDAHLHFCKEDEYFNQIAMTAGHINTKEHLEEQFHKYNIVRGVVMGNRDLKLEHHQYPDFLSYCIGLDGFYLRKNQLSESVDMVEKHLQKKNCVGIKLYPGYSHIYVTDPLYEPFYSLAEKYGKPVAIHTGATSSSNALLKYSQPMILDELAVRHRKVQFVMCHFGNPWLTDAAAVMEKNPNVATDLSGLLEGRVNVDAFFEENKSYIEMLKMWLAYFRDYDRIMYGTDWPLVNIGEYIAFITRLIPEKYHEQVFYKNAKRIYQLDCE